MGHPTVLTQESTDAIHDVGHGIDQWRWATEKAMDMSYKGEYII